jgi:hypothetical protein
MAWLDHSIVIQFEFEEIKLLPAPKTGGSP